jgi:hypothetical protein
MDESEVIMTVDNAGTKKWKNKIGRLHRLDGPAVEFANGTKEWHQNGQFHRSSGPAYVRANGHKEWHFRGMLHREDGPAIIFSSGRKGWWIRGAKYKTKESYFDALSDEAKARCLFSEDFLNG